MGDEILKTLLKLFFLIFTSSCLLEAKENLSLGNEVKAYDQIFEKIAERRVGVSSVNIEKIANPFITLQTEASNDANATDAKPVYILEATFDDRAKINGKWYKKREVVDAYTVLSIKHNSVVLENEIEKKELYIRTKDDSNFKISYK